MLKLIIKKSDSLTAETIKLSKTPLPHGSMARSRKFSLEKPIWPIWGQVAMTWGMKIYHQRLVNTTKSLNRKRTRVQLMIQNKMSNWINLQLELKNQRFLQKHKPKRLRQKLQKRRLPLRRRDTQSSLTSFTLVLSLGLWMSIIRRPSMKAFKNLLQPMNNFKLWNLPLRSTRKVWSKLLRLIFLISLGLSWWLYWPLSRDKRWPTPCWHSASPTDSKRTTFTSPKPNKMVSSTSP